MDRADDMEPVPASRIARSDEGGLSAGLKVGIVFSMLAGALLLLWFSTTAEDAFVYSKLVDDVLEDPAAFRDRDVRIEGDLKQGSILFQESPCEWRFVLGQPGKEMPVRFPQCIVPDTFKDGMGLKVTVQGRLGEDGHFVASQLIPRCPSKYEMQQAKLRGEKMPHVAPPAMRPM